MQIGNNESEKSISIGNCYVLHACRIKFLFLHLSHEETHNHHNNNFYRPFVAGSLSFKEHSYDNENQISLTCILCLPSPSSSTVMSCFYCQLNSTFIMSSKRGRDTRKVLSHFIWLLWRNNNDAVLLKHNNYSLHLSLALFFLL